MKPKFWGGTPGEKLLPPFTHVPLREPDPRCVAGAELGHWFTHFHARAIGLRGILQFGIAAQDDRALEFVRRAYEFTLTQGIPRIGWINCYPVSDNRCECCALADYIAMAIRLTDAGLGDYWDDVDSCVRNHLVEHQLVRKDLIEQCVASFKGPYLDVFTPAAPRQLVTENVIDRCLGIFGGTSHPTSIPTVWSMGCCTGNGTQGLYYVWEGIVRESGDTAQVNLLLNRAAKLVDVDSYLPFEGKVVIKNKSARRISVRIPAWVDKRELRAYRRSGVSPLPSTVTDESGGTPLLQLDWIGRYLVFESLKPNDILTIQFPIKETTARYTANAQTPHEKIYTCTFRGSTLVDITPRDETPTSYPFYLRDEMRKDKAPMKKTTRFVADNRIRDW